MNKTFIEKAQNLIPQLYENTEQLSVENESCGKGDRIVLDFGHNHAAYFGFDCVAEGIQDAPVFLKIRFCELEKEIDENCKDYDGWISRGWIQEEWIHIDELPCRVELKRRYAFRYAVINVLDTSQKFRVVFRRVQRKTVSAVREEDCSSLKTEDILLKKIDEVSVRTLANCMQTVFEDGPKRDRRLWLGDLRLQALTNYYTFQNYDLVKRCLYLFAGLTDEKGRIPACVFEKPKPHRDDTFLLDYSLLFLFVLTEYYQYSKDRETLEELSSVAFHQIEDAIKFVDKDGCICEAGAEYHCFIDWAKSLDKQCAMQGVVICSLKKAAELCLLLHKEEKARNYKALSEKMSRAARKKFWNEEKGAFASGSENQISSASQVWMALAGVIDGMDAAEILTRTGNSKIKMVTPYMHHYYVTALIRSNEKEKALAHLKNYWGGMIEEGADTFWELYNPENPEESPYGGVCVNSFCHAWSCSPAYLLRDKGLNEEYGENM